MAQQDERGEQATTRGATRKRMLGVSGLLRGRIGLILRFQLAFELLRWLILAPLATGVLSLGLERWGRPSVGNFEILAFLASPTGLAAVIGVGTIGLSTVYFQLAGLLLLLANQQAAWWSVFPVIGKRILFILGVGLRQFIVIVALAVPFLGTGAVVLKLFWAGQDLNGLIVLRPPLFWLGAAVCACLGVIYALIVVYLALRWLLALPIVLFEPGTWGGKALRLSTRRTRGRRLSMLGFTALWLVAVVLLASVLIGGLRLGSGWLLDSVGLSLPVLLPVTAIVLILHALVAILLSVLNGASFASLVFIFYREAAGLPLPERGPVQPVRGLVDRLPARWRIALVAVTLVGTIGLLCHMALARLRLNERVEITAHRAGGAVAPENTVAALRKAVEAQADWAEIDVQLTADGAFVVLHDSDLVRVGGVRLRVPESTLAQIQSVDVGSRFGKQFQGEHVPILDELIPAAVGRIRLNIELKPNAPKEVEPLVRGVVDSVRRAGIAGRTRLCSQSYESLQLAKQLEPALQIGFIAGGKLGDLSKLKVNFLMVAERLATRRLTERAKIHGIEVHAWTINNPELLAPLLDRGVDNIITDDPAAMRRKLEEIRRLSPAERLLLSARNLLVD